MHVSSQVLIWLFVSSFSYLLLVVPTILLVRDSGKSGNGLLLFILSFKYLSIYTIILFFCLSGLPLTNLFILKWFCFYKIGLLGLGSYYVFFIFFNIFYIIFYLFFFNKVYLSLKNKKSWVFLSLPSDNYPLLFFFLFSIFFNFIGVFIYGYVFIILS